MVTLLLVRHAEAEDRESAAVKQIPDHRRALTDKGRRRMARVAASLADLVPDLTQVATSPLRRAVQTAEILAAAFPGAGSLHADCLAPGAGPEAVARFVAGWPLAGPAALVGHQPDLGLFASWALSGARRSFLPLGKSGAALLRFPDAPAAGSGELLWLLTPSQLRRLRSK